MYNPVSIWAVPGLTDGFSTRKPSSIWFCQPGKRNPGMWDSDDHLPHCIPESKGEYTPGRYPVWELWRFPELILCLSLCFISVVLHGAWSTWWARSVRYKCPLLCGKGLKQTSCSHRNESFRMLPEKPLLSTLKEQKQLVRRKDPLRKRFKQIHKNLSRYSSTLRCQCFPSFFHLIYFRGIVWSLSSEKTAQCWERKGSSLQFAPPHVFCLATR